MQPQPVHSGVGPIETVAFVGSAPLMFVLAHRLKRSIARARRSTEIKRRRSTP